MNVINGTYTVTIESIKHWPEGGVSLKTNTGNYIKPGKALRGMDFQQLIGRPILASLFQPEGKQTVYITDYDFPPGDGGPVTPPPPATGSQSAAAPRSAPSQPDSRQASIEAQTCLKAWASCPREVTPGEVVAAFREIQQRLDGQTVDIEPEKPDPTRPAFFDDDIPF